MLHETNYDYVPGTSGIDDRFLPPKYRGLTMDQLDKQLEENFRTRYKNDLERIPNGLKYANAMEQVRKDMGLNASSISEDDEDFTDDDDDFLDDELTELKIDMGISNLSDERMEIMNRNIRHYKGQVANALIGLQRKLDWCDGNEQRSRQVLKELEKAHPGSDYGSSEDDGNAVCRSARFLFEDKIAGIEHELLFIKETKDKNDFYFNVLTVRENEESINHLLGLTKGISDLDAFPIHMNYSTEPDGIMFNDKAPDYDEQNARKMNPELARKLEILENKYRSLNERREWYQTQIVIDYDFSRALPHLRTMKPIGESDAKKYLARIRIHNSYNSQDVNGWKVVAVSDSGEILVKETNNPPNYAVYDKDGALNDFVRNYKEIIYETDGSMKEPVQSEMLS